MTDEQKCQRVIDKNTFYFFNKSFEESYEGHINSLKQTLHFLKNEIDSKGLQKNIFENLLAEKENGLRAILALTGFSNEMLKRIITMARIVDVPELNKLMNKPEWSHQDNMNQMAEYGTTRITKMVRHDRFFRKGIVNLFFEGATIPFLVKTIPLFELKKLSLGKLKFDFNELLDTLVRYKEKGSYSARGESNSENVIADILNHHNISFEKGDLPLLKQAEPNSKRTLDFIIPNKTHPVIVIEISFLATTSSGQGDKAKTEINLDKLIKNHYPNIAFIGFVDGIGWLVRRGDLQRLVTAFDDVFTFYPDELKRFHQFVIEKIR
ncbi:MAG: DpnII family type II restriction endonuclease [Alphaproteobacteria bacterium]